MASWQGANVRRHSSGSTDPVVHRETVEAAMNRLSKSYNTAMESVGSLHRADRTANEEQHGETRLRDEIQSLAETARHAFENVVLKDPLVAAVDVADFTMLYRYLRISREVLAKKAITLTSAANKTKVKQISYLTLVNYADLLLSACACFDNKNTSYKNLLDNIQYLVPRLLSVKQSTGCCCCCWKDEPAQKTAQLALFAYMDASAFDGSDPILWLKLACTARHLSRILDLQQRETSSTAIAADAANVNTTETPAILLRYRRLEKYALERATWALPQSVPPNRMVVRAMREWKEEERYSGDYPPCLVQEVEALPQTTLHLTRYSWSTLGRALIRVCKDGSGVSRPSTKQSGYVHPLVNLYLSPLLSLPTTVLGKICTFLELQDILMLESTCRALSASVLTARAALDLSEDTKLEEKTHEEELNEQQKEEIGLDSPKTKTKAPTQASRVSKRLRSQIISSGKRAERSYRRHSVSFCLLAATLRLTKESKEYKKMLTEGVNWDSLLGISSSVNTKQDTRKEANAVGFEEATQRLSVSSISSFVERWKDQYYPPLRIAIAFIAHLSLYVGDVYVSDVGGAGPLTACAMECFDLISKRFKVTSGFVPQSLFEQRTFPWGSAPDALEIFAIELLRTELRFQRFESDEDFDTGFDDDANFVAMIVPRLLSNVITLPNDNRTRLLQSLKLKIRCYWLVARYFIWRSRLPQSLVDSREAETRGHKFIDETLESLKLPCDSPIKVVSTPHLDSSQNRQIYVKEISIQSVQTYRNEIQASSVVLMTRERFFEAISKLRASVRGGTELIQEELWSIGDKLLERYSAASDSLSCKLTELVDDFVSIHGEKLAQTDWELSESDSWFDAVVPNKLDELVLLKLENPSILTILVSCLLVGSYKTQEVILLLSHVITSIVQLWYSAEKPDPRAIFGSESDGDISDDDSFTSEASLNRRSLSLEHKKTKLFQHWRLVRLLFARVVAYVDANTQGYANAYASSKDCRQMTSALLIFSSEVQIYRIMSLGADQQPTQNQLIMREILFGIRHLGSPLGSETCVPNPMTNTIICGLIHIIVNQQQLVAEMTQKRSKSRDLSNVTKAIKENLDLVAYACVELGLTLSVFDNAVEAAAEEEQLMKPNVLSSLCDSLLWLWGRITVSDVSNGLDRITKDRLRIPVACAIVGLVGSEVITSQEQSKASDELVDVSLTEFYDSDASAVDWVGDDLTSPVQGNKSMEEKLISWSQAVHCMNHVIHKIDEREATSYDFCQNYSTEHGPALALIATRVLNKFANRLLLTFPSEDGNTVWTAFPVGTRTVGSLIDATLATAYKSLHGFTLNTSSDGRETSAGGTAFDESRRRYKPENSAAASGLYRCIMRLYGHGRKSPPKSALDTVLAALPPVEESNRSKAVNDFLFSATDSESQKYIRNIVEESGHDRKQFEWVSVGDDGDETFDDGCDDITTVRRGVSKLLAQVPMPQYQEAASGKARDASSIAENELSRKFFAIIENQSFGSKFECDAWYEAAQCLFAKAELIADRIGLTNGFGRNRGFLVDSHNRKTDPSLKIPDLFDEQEKEFQRRRDGWVPFLGRSILPYVKFSWSSFSSLREFSVELVKQYSQGPVSNDDDEALFHLTLIEEIELLYSKKSFAKWQQAWGGQFISALRCVAYRCLAMAMNLLQTTSEEKRDRLMVSEVAEALGTSLYAELMGNQVYGYPMHSMPPFQRRELADVARVCFEKAISVTSVQNDDGGNRDDRVTWDLLMMVGKCSEKIAKTYRQESFSERIESMRKYEIHMKSALNCYHRSYVEAREIEGDGDLLVEQNGGSAHGATEPLYRLHATRLKCLIHAVDARDSDRDFAELEALRITEEYWYKKPEAQSEDLTVRDRVWNVLVDIVACLAQCRIEHSFFHRSVYRHAQALMWAPVLCDPIHERAKGGLGTVPATRAFMLRGLNYSTHAADSAFAVISSLFDKKRAQLCAVWVTSSASATSFQTINNSVRKYDSLRGKYISAYIDCLRICQKRNDLETFMRWINLCQRDLPSYFHVTANPQCEQSVPPHSKDSLVLKRRSIASYFFLTGVKRKANNALASVILVQLKESTSKDQKVIESFLKSAFACFLRLNCDSQEIERMKLLKYHQSSGVKDVFDLFIAAYLRFDQKASPVGTLGDWSGLGQSMIVFENALKKCSKEFPTVSSNFYTSRAPKPKKATEQSSGTKRPAPESTAPEQTSRSFEVDVPTGLSAGDTFLAAIQDGGKIKKVRLTVPEGNATTLRFTLQVESSPSDQPVEE